MYFDDIFVFYTSPSDSLAHIRKVLTLLHSAGMNLCLTKLFLMQSSVDYFGHVFHPENLSVANGTLDAIDDETALHHYPLTVLFQASATYTCASCKTSLELRVE